MPNRLNLDGAVSSVNVVEDSKAVHPQFPLCQLVRPQSLVVPCFAVGLILQARLDLSQHPPSVTLAIRPHVLDSLRREMDRKHSAHSVYHWTWLFGARCHSPYFFGLLLVQKFNMLSPPPPPLPRRLIMRRKLFPRIPLLLFVFLVAFQDYAPITVGSSSGDRYRADTESPPSTAPGKATMFLTARTFLCLAILVPSPLETSTATASRTWLRQTTSTTRRA